MAKTQFCKAHRWFVPNWGRNNVALAECLVCPTKQYQPIDGIRESVVKANNLNKRHGYPRIPIPDRIFHREPLQKLLKIDAMDDFGVLPEENIG